MPRIALEREREKGMRNWMSRRRLMQMMVGLVGMAAGSEQARAEESSPTGSYYWRYVRSDCTGGTAHEYWCYRYCDLTGCRDVYCEWRNAGSC